MKRTTWLVLGAVALVSGCCVADMRQNVVADRCGCSAHHKPHSKPAKHKMHKQLFVDAYHAAVGAAYDQRCPYSHHRPSKPKAK